MIYVQGTGIDKDQVYRGQAKIKQYQMFRYVVNGLVDRGPYFFQARCVNGVGISAWSSSSNAFYLHQTAPARMASPTLHKADTSTSLLVKYVPPCDLGITDSGDLDGFEMRYCRFPSVLEDEDADMARPNDADCVCLNLPVPPLAQLYCPDPVRIQNLMTGRTYCFQVRATSRLGAGQWSDISQPYETLPSRPEKPEALIGEMSTACFRSFDLRMLLPESCGRPVTRCRLRMQGPYWLSKGARGRPRTAEWQDLHYEIELHDCDEEWIRPSERHADEGMASFDPVWTRVWQQDRKSVV